MGSKQVETLREVWRIFHEALEKKGGERESFLKSACREDNGLKQRVEELLHSHENAPGFLETPAISRPTPASELSAGNHLGQYTLFKEIGRGGMGVIYEAEQSHPHRKVALKLLHGALVSKSFLNRFEREAEILARLQHPGIAQVFESGSVDTPTGAQPYFAMELVRGKTLNEYCEEEKLSTRERLKLLIQIAQAVQYAHQQGVIHRDLKSANILVDQSGKTKILDFGVARIQSADLQAMTLQTKGGDFLGTLPYMSPEQLESHLESVDTRADVYALGVIGYELLAGRLPFDVSDISLTEAVRIISHDTPLLLGTFNREFRGDLETIFAKALEKEKERRYASASEFAADLERYLDSRPILARPPSTSYQFRKFVQRHKLPTALFCTLFLSLCGFLIYASTQAERLRKERDRALQAESLAEKKAHEAQQAEKLAQENAVAAQLAENLAEKQSEEASLQAKLAKEEAEKATKIADFFQEMFILAIPDKNGPKVTLLEALDLTESRIGKDLAFAPEIERSLRELLVQVFGMVGQREQAHRQAHRALELSEELYGEEHPLHIRALMAYGSSLSLLGEIQEAERTLRRARALSQSGPGADAETFLAATNSLGGLFQKTKRRQAAKELYEESIGISKLLYGEESWITLTMQNQMGTTLINLQELAQTEPFLRKTLEDCKRLTGEKSTMTLLATANLSVALFNGKKYEEARALCRRAVELFETVVGKDHPDTMEFMKKAEVILASKGQS